MARPLLDRWAGRISEAPAMSATNMASSKMTAPVMMGANADTDRHWTRAGCKNSESLVIASLRSQ